MLSVSIFVLCKTSSLFMVAFEVSFVCSWITSFSSFNALAPWEIGLEFVLEKLKDSDDPKFEKSE